MRSRKWHPHRVRGASIAATIIAALLSGCSGGGGGRGAPAAVAVQVTASPAKTVLDGPVTLSWTTTGASTCTATGAWTGTQSLQGAATVNVASLPATYGLSCTGSAGTGTGDVTVTGAGTPTAVVMAPDQAKSFATILLDGSGSYNSTNGAHNTQFAWTQTAGPPVTLSKADEVQTRFTVPEIKSPNATLTFSLTITDDTGVTGQSTASIQAVPASAAQLAVDIVSARLMKPLAGEHADAGPWSGSPRSGANAMLQAVLTRYVDSPTFTLVDAAGNSLGTPTLSALGRPSTQPAAYIGAITIPAVPFGIGVSGTSSDGQTFTREATPLFYPGAMELDLSPERLVLTPGESATSQLTIYNDGAAATFALVFVDAAHLLSATPPSSIQVAAQSSASVPLSLTYPSNASGLIGPRIEIQASVAGDASRRGSVELSIWDRAP
jgi:hypothetical protein